MAKTRETYYKELRVTHRFLSECDLAVPRELMVEISRLLQEEQQRRHQRKLNRATEEQLIRMHNKPMRILQIMMADGMLVRGATNAQTYLDALEEIGLDRLLEFDFRYGKHAVLIYDPTLKRRRIQGYWFLRPGYFVCRLKDSRAMAKVLDTIDRTLQLNMQIKLV